MTTIDGGRAHAGFGEMAIAGGSAYAARSVGATMMFEKAGFRPLLHGQAAGFGALVGIGGEGASRLLDAASPLDRFESHVAVGLGGAAMAVAGWRAGSGAMKAAGSAGRVLGVAGGLGAGLDKAHHRFDADADGHFLPEVPRAVELGVGGLVVGGLGLKYGRKAVTAYRMKDLLAGSAAEVDAAGMKLGELIPRSKLTIGPKIFLGSRIEDGHGTAAIRTVVPHELDAATLASLGLPAKPAREDLAALGIRSLEQQGAFAIDDAGRPAVDLILEGSPTGMGGLNVAPVMMAEQLARTATIDAQYGAKPSVQSLHKVNDAIEQFVAVSKATRDRVALMPEGARPPRVGVATSLGGLQFDELIRREGHGIIDELGLAKVVTLGAPTRLSKLDPATLPEGYLIRATFDEFAKLDPERVAAAKVIELRHPDDPVPFMSLDMLYRRPDWLPADRPFVPGVTFLQHAGDVTTSISRGTGPRVSHGGHEYREQLSNEAFARALGLTAPSDEAFRTAAVRAQDTAVAEAKRLREQMFGGVPKPTPAPPSAG